MIVKRFLSWDFIGNIRFGVFLIQISFLQNVGGLSIYRQGWRDYSDNILQIRYKQINWASSLQMKRDFENEIPPPILTTTLKK